MKNKFVLAAPYEPAGDQINAIKELIDNIDKNNYQVLLGATGTGKTFTIAKLIEHTQRKTLVLAHNKTLASQLYLELKNFFPNNKVEYFVSYFDFFQPEAYLPRSDTYIEKSAQSNSEIEMMRLSTLNSLVNYNDVIVVASVASIYPTSSREDYDRYRLFIKVGANLENKFIRTSLIKLEFELNSIDSKPGTFRFKGDVLDIAPGYTDEYIYRISMFGTEIEKINKIDALTGNVIEKLDSVLITPANEYLMNKDDNSKALENIKKEMLERVKYFNLNNKLIEAERIEQRTKYDLESMREFGVCNGIENYAAQLEGRKPGDTPFSLMDYFNFNNEEWLFVIDESHMSIPQIRGMYNTDRSRKETLVEYGFRLPSALDNRPLKFDELFSKLDKTIFVSATPNEWEIEKSNNVVIQQIVRPTGLLDPTIEIRETKFQIDDLINELHKQRVKNERTFVSVMTIRMAEELTEYLKQREIKVAYIHNELKTLERSKVLYDLRKGKFEVIIGINLLREGIDVPEVSLMVIFDANKSGLFRSEKSLIQMIGRAARNSNGHVIMYADYNSKDMDRAIDETNRRRQIQIDYNIKNKIIPTTIIKDLSNHLFDNGDIAELIKSKKSPASIIKKLKYDMLSAAKERNYELAAALRDQITELAAIEDSKKNN